jgi:DNA-binding CsgD family transcriptional regulator
MLVQRKQQADTGMRMLDSVSPSILMVRADGEIVYINPAAHALLRANPVLSIRMNRIWAPNPQKYQQLKSAINKMMALEPGIYSEPAENHVVIHSTKDTLYVHLSLISHATNTMPWIKQLLGEQAMVMLQITDLKHGLSINTRQQLLSIYQLSKAELNIAGLVAEGLQVSEISTLLQLSANTIRAQLKAIYKKTHTSRQSELMQLLLRLES